MTVTVDRASIRENLLDDIDLIHESIDLFMDSSATRLKALREAVAAKDPKQIMSEAHALKGVVGIFSPGEVMEAAKVIEFMGRDAQLDGVEAALTKFEGLLSELTVLLKEWREEEEEDEDFEDDE